MELNRSHIPLFWGFLLLSLLLHLLLLYLVPERRPLLPPAKKEPMEVEMRPPETRERELDLPVPPEEEPRTEPARRLGPADQQVARETAPEGDAPEDRAPPAAAPPRPQPSPPSVEPKPRAEPIPKPQREPKSAEVARPAPETAPAPDRREVEPPEAKRPLNVPDLRTLTQLPATTIARLEDQWRNKYRKDVEQGDAVWLDTERDILISLFRRLRNNIYGVWNYPPESAAQMEEGTCLLRITLNHDGTVQEVKVLESSGYRRLDREAVAAVHKGAPYGDLPRAYTEDELSIYAFFSYTLTRRTIY